MTVCLFMSWIQALETNGESEDHEEVSIRMVGPDKNVDFCEYGSFSVNKSPMAESEISRRTVGDKAKVLLERIFREYAG